MLVHSYPLLLSLYKGEGRILIVPLIDHVAGYSIDVEWYENISDTDNAKNVGNGVLRAVAYIRNDGEVLADIFWSLAPELDSDKQTEQFAKLFEKLIKNSRFK